MIKAEGDSKGRRAGYYYSLVSRLAEYQEQDKLEFYSRSHPQKKFYVRKHRYNMKVINQIEKKRDGYHETDFETHTAYNLFNKCRFIYVDKRFAN